jgi:hypothetical protein
MLHAETGPLLGFLFCFYYHEILRNNALVTKLFGKAIRWNEV